MSSSITSLSPTPRNGKHGWYDQFQKHNFLLNTSKAKILILGDSSVSNLLRYPEIWRKYFINPGAILVLLEIRHKTYCGEYFCGGTTFHLI